MGRKSHSNYNEIAQQVLTELGGGPLASRDLVAAAQERGLLGDGKWVYHNFLRELRSSANFDTSVRGQVSLFAEGAAAKQEVPEAEVSAPAPTLTVDEEDTVEEEHFTSTESI